MIHHKTSLTLWFWSASNLQANSPSFWCHPWQVTLYHWPFYDINKSIGECRPMLTAHDVFLGVERKGNKRVMSNVQTSSQEEHLIWTKLIWNLWNRCEVQLLTAIHGFLYTQQSLQGCVVSILGIYFRWLYRIKLMFHQNRWTSTTCIQKVFCQ